MPADQSARGDDQPEALEVVFRYQPCQQGEPRAVRPAELALQLALQFAWGSAALGDGQLVAQHEDLGVLRPGILVRQTSPCEQIPVNQVDQSQRHEERSSHVAMVIGTLKSAQRVPSVWKL